MSAILREPLLRFRPMQSDDLPQVMQVEKAAYGHPWTPGIFRDCLRVCYSCWICEIDATAIGHTVMSISAGEAHLLNLCVHPEWQRLGLGRSLLRRCLRIARERNADTMFLEVRLSNAAAQRLYEGEGFNEIGHRRDYYPNGATREDAIVYAKALL